MMSKKLVLTLLCGLMLKCGFSQTKTASKIDFQHELGLNVTNLLTDLLGNNNRTDPGLYLLSYKKVNGNKALRMGATINFSVKDQNTLSFNTRLANQNFQLRIGRETRQSISTRFQYYYGFDGIAGFQQEQSIANVNSGSIVQTDQIITIGGGPVLGFQFVLYDRLLIGTEGSFYAAYNTNSTDFKSFGSLTIPSRSSKGLNLQTNLPKFLFLIVKF